MKKSSFERNSLSESIRAIRKDVRKNQAEFAELLGIQPNTVSKYETGRSTPDLLILLRLWGLASDYDKDVVKDEILKQLGGGISELELFLGLAEKERGAGVLPVEKRNPDFLAFLSAVDDVIHQAQTVDDSVTRLLRFWAKYESRKSTVRHFRAAEAFLRVQLALDESRGRGTSVQEERE